MLPYVLLISIPIVFLWVCKNREKKYQLNVGIGVSQIENENFALPVFFLYLFALLALRHESIGRDLPNYKTFFNVYKDISFKELFGQSVIQTDIGFMVIDWLIGQVTDSYQVYLAIMAAIMLIPMGLLYCEDRYGSYLKILLFVNMSTFIMLFSGLRQSLTIGGGCWAYWYIREKNWKKFLIVALLLLPIHHSTFIVLSLYPVYHCKIRKRHLLFVVPAVLFVFLFNRQIFGMMSGILMRFSDEYETVMKSTGAYTMLILLGMFMALAFVIPDESKMSDEDFGLRNFLVVTVIMQCFAPVNQLAMRLNYYYLIFVPIAVPKMIKKTSKQYEQVAGLAMVVLILFFAFYFLNSTYNSYLTGISALDTVPYIPFWEGKF